MALEGVGGGSHAQGSGSSQSEESSVTEMLARLMADQQANHRVVMHRLDQQEARIEELMRRYPPPPPPQG